MKASPGNLHFRDFLFAFRIRAKRELCAICFLVDGFHFAFDPSRDLFADRRIAVSRAGRHLHFFEDDHVVGAFQLMLHLIHSRLEQSAAGLNRDIEMNFAFLSDGEILAWDVGHQDRLTLLVRYADVTQDRRRRAGSDPEPVRSR